MSRELWFSLWSLQVLYATTKATTQDSTEEGKICGAFIQYQMAALLTGEMNVTRPIRSAITLPYIQISSYSEGGNTKHEYWLWVDPWNHVRSGDLTGTTMKGVKHGYYSRFQSDYNPLDYYYYYDHVHYTVAESTPRYPHIVQDSDAYPSLDPLFLMHGGRMTRQSIVEKRATVIS